MLLVLQLLVVSLLPYNVIFNGVEAENVWRGCKYFPYGEAAVATAAKIKDNLINVVGYLEQQISSNIPNEVSTYLSTLKRNLVGNFYDIFHLIPYMDHVQHLTSSRERVLFLLTQLEHINFKSNCGIQCRVKQWEVIPNFRDILDSVPYNLTVHGMTLVGSRDMLFMKNIGLKFRDIASPNNDNERDINTEFGPSILQILQRMRHNKYCFNEKFFGYLLTFYPWPSTDGLSSLALDKLRYYFTNGKINFIACGIYMSDLDPLMQQPWTVLDYILTQMDSSGCQRSLDWDIKLLLAARQFTKPRETLDFQVESLLDLLNIINPQVYPLHIVIAADRVRRFLKKLLPYADIENYVGYRYGTTEERLLALLDYATFIDPYPVNDVSDSLNAVKSTLLFQIGPQSISTKLLNLILDSWWTVDILDFVREDVVRLKVFVRSHFATIDEILTLHSSVKCTGIIPCYMKILSIFEYAGFPNLAAGLTPLPQLTSNLLDCEGASATNFLIPEIVALLQYITCHNYPQHAVMSVNNIIAYISQANNHISVYNNPHIYTKEQLLIALLKVLGSTNELAQIHNDVNVVLKEIDTKTKGQISVEHSQTSPDLSLFVINVANIVTVVNKIRDKKRPFPELDAALTYISQHADYIDDLIKDANCRNTNTLTCFNAILKIIKLKSPVVQWSVYPLRYVLSPNVCSKTFCRWLPYEELESGPLNPVLDIIKYLITELKNNVTHFQLQLNVDVILKTIKTEDLRPVLLLYNFDGRLDSKGILLVFLKVLWNNVQTPDVIFSINHVTEYLNTRNTKINTLSPQNVFSLVEILISMTTSEVVATSMKGTLQLLYKNKDKLTNELVNLKVDCSTLELCVSSLIRETNYTTANSIINSISSAVNPKECNRLVCPWLNKVQTPNPILLWVLETLQQITTEQGTPLAILFAIDRIRSFLSNPEFLPILQKVTEMNIDANTATTTVLKFIAQDVYLPPTIRRDAQNILNYMFEKIPPRNINADDLNKLLVLYAEHLTNQTLIDTIHNILSQIEINRVYWHNLLINFDIECTTLQFCINNLITSIKQYGQTDESVVLLLYVLGDSSTQTTETPKLVPRLLQQIIKLLAQENIPTIVKVDLRVLKNIFSEQNLSEILNDLIGVSSDAILLQVLHSLPITFKLQHGIVDIVTDVIRYLTDNVLPTRLSMLSLEELANILIAMTSSDAVKTEIAHSVRILEQLPHTSEALLHLPVKGHTLQSIVDSIVRNIRQMNYKNLVMQ